MTREAINPSQLALTLFSLLILILFFSVGIFMPTSDDLLLAYGHEIKSTIPMSDWVSTQVSHNRFIPAILGELIQSQGYDYFHLTGFWIFGFAFTLWFCTLEFIRYVKLPSALTPLITLAIGLHGFWAELLQFLQAYINYSLSLFAIGMVFLCARYLTKYPVINIGLIGFWIWIAFLSYQPMALIPIFAVSLVFIRDFFLEPHAQKQRSLKDVFPIIFGFLCAGIFFILTYTQSPEPSRPVSFSWEMLFFNTSLYIFTLPSLFLPLFSTFSYHLIFPLHERFIYGLAQIGAGIALFQAPKSKIRRLAFLGLFISFLLSAGPMRILIAYPYLTTPRSIAPTAFFHVGLAFILALVFMDFLKKKYPNWPHKLLFFGALFTLIGFSFANQLSLVYERSRQYVQDEAIAHGILADLKKEGLLYAGSPVALLSPNPYHIAQLQRVFFIQFPISTFWTNLSTGVAMLSRASGIALKTVPHYDLWDIAHVDPSLDLYEALCGNASMPWEIRKRDGMTLVCLPSEGPQ